MNQVLDEWAKRLKSIQEAWDEAEHAIKLAEQIQQEIINPSIYELRYAGRRIVEAFKLHSAGDTDGCERLTTRRRV